MLWDRNSTSFKDCDERATQHSSMKHCFSHIRYRVVPQDDQECRPNLRLDGDKWNQEQMRRTSWHKPISDNSGYLDCEQKHFFRSDVQEWIDWIWTIIPDFQSNYLNVVACAMLNLPRATNNIEQGREKSIVISGNDFNRMHKRNLFFTVRYQSSARSRAVLSMRSSNEFCPCEDMLVTKKVCNTDCVVEALWICDANHGYGGIGDMNKKDRVFQLSTNW